MNLASLESSSERVAEETRDTFVSGAKSDSGASSFFPLFSSVLQLQHQESRLHRFDQEMLLSTEQPEDGNWNIDSQTTTQHLSSFRQSHRKQQRRKEKLSTSVKNTSTPNNDSKSQQQYKHRQSFFDEFHRQLDAVVVKTDNDTDHFSQSIRNHITMSESKKQSSVTTDLDSSSEFQEDAHNDEKSDCLDEETIATEPTVVNPQRYYYSILHDKQKQNETIHSNTSSEVENSEEEEDDSAAYCPTIRHEPHRTTRMENAFSTHANTFSPSQYWKDRPSEINVGPPSPTPTNITIDTVMAQSHTTAPYSKHFSTTNTDTSVLDRYRLDPDSESPLGFKVVPNDESPKLPPLPTPPPTLEPVTPKTHEKVLRPRNRTKRVFRKTPHPKTRMAPPTIDENEPLQLSYASATNHDMPSVQALDQGRTSPLIKDTSTFIRLVAGHTVDQCLSAIRIDEYQAAPRIFQMQVTLHELNSALEVFRKEMVSSPEPCWSADEMHTFLSTLDWPHRKATSVLMSLCHYRRLVMHRENDHLYFRTQSVKC